MSKTLLVSGMIGLGKTSVSEFLGEEMGLEVLYESVEDNPILPFLYTATKEDEQRERYPFLLQMWFLNTRYEAMKKALKEGNKILDRVIFEDNYFAEKFLKQGKLNQNEYMIYRKFLNTCINDLSTYNDNKPDLMIYLKGSFDTVMSRINERGRGYEVAPELRDYYFDIWKDYDQWIYRNYRASDILVVDMDKIDIVNNPDDKLKLLQMVKDKLKEIGEGKNE